MEENIKFDENQKISIENLSEEKILNLYVKHKIMNPVVLYLAKEWIKEIFDKNEIDIKQVLVDGYCIYQSEKSDSLKLKFIVKDNYEFLKTIEKEFHKKFNNNEIYFEPLVKEIDNDVKKKNLEDIFEEGKELFIRVKNIIGRLRILSDKKLSKKNEIIKYGKDLEISDIYYYENNNEDKNTTQEIEGILINLGMEYNLGNETYIDIVKRCLVIGERSDLFDVAHHCNIFEACKHGETNIVKKIVTYDSNQSKIDNIRGRKWYNTPLEEAFNSNNKDDELIEFLIEKDANVDFILEGDQEKIPEKISLEKFVKNHINKPENIYPCSSKYKGMNVLHIATYLLYEDSVKKILEQSSGIGKVVVLDGEFKNHNIFHLATKKFVDLYVEEKFSYREEEKSENLKKLETKIINIFKIFFSKIEKNLVKSPFPEEEKSSANEKDETKKRIKTYSTILEKIIAVFAIDVIKLLIPTYFSIKDVFYIGPNKRRSVLQLGFLESVRFSREIELFKFMFEQSNETEKKEFFKTQISTHFNDKPFHAMVKQLHYPMLEYCISYCGDFVNENFSSQTELCKWLPVYSDEWLPIHLVVESIIIRARGELEKHSPDFDILETPQIKTLTLLIKANNVNLEKSFPSGIFENLTIPQVLFVKILALFSEMIYRLYNGHYLRGLMCHEEFIGKVKEIYLKIEKSFDFFLSQKIFLPNVFYNNKTFIHETVLSNIPFEYKQRLIEWLIKNQFDMTLKTRELMPQSVLQLADSLPYTKNDETQTFNDFLFKKLKSQESIEDYKIKETPKIQEENKENLKEKNIKSLPISLVDEDNDSVVTNPTLLKTLKIIVEKLNLKNIDIVDYANFTVPRVALHITIIYLAMKIQSEDEEKFKQIVTELYEKSILPYLLKEENSIKINTEIEKIETGYRNRIEKTLENKYSYDSQMEEKSQEIYLLTREWVESDELSELFDQEDKKKDLLKGMLFAHFIHDEIYNLLYKHLIPEMRQYLTEKDIQTLTYNNNTERVSWTILGGPGSGKSHQLVNKQIKKDLGNVYSDICRIDPDSYKKLLVNNKIIEKFKDNPSHCLEYVHEESSFISKKIVKYLKKSVDGNEGPNILIDTVKPNDMKTNLVSYKLATSYFYIANCVINKAIERVEKRRLETGRPVPLKVLLEGHRQQSQILNHIKSGKHFVYIFDTTDDNETIKIASLETGKEMLILNFLKMLEFVSKEKINSDADESLDNLYGENKKNLTVKIKIELLMKYVEANITLKLTDPEDEKPYAYISPDNKLIILNFEKFIKNMGDDKNFEVFNTFLEYKNTDHKHIDIVIQNELVKNSDFQKKVLVIEKNKIIWCEERILKDKSNDFISYLKNRYPEEFKINQEKNNNKKRRNSIDFFQIDLRENKKNNTGNNQKIYGFGKN